MTTDKHLDKIVARLQLLADLTVPSHAFASAVIAIQGLRVIASQGSHPESSSAKCDLHKIINLWPEKLL